MESVAHHLSNLRRLDVSIGGESRLTLGGMQAAVAHCKRLHTLGYERREAFANVDWRARALDGTAIEG